MSGPGTGIPACTEADPPCGQTDRCKNITFATSFAGGSKRNISEEKNCSLQPDARCKWDLLYQDTVLVELLVNRNVPSTGQSQGCACFAEIMWRARKLSV